MEFIWKALILSVGLNITLFLPAYFLKTDKLTDIAYALTFWMVSGYTLMVRMDLVSITALVMVWAWAIRLGGYLLIRIFKVGKDQRFDTIRVHFFKFFGFWLLQGVTVFIVLFPTICLVAKGRDRALTGLSIAGIAIYAVGLLLESVADYQKYLFKCKVENKGKWIDQGVWRYTRHPNYLGEILVWIGIYLFSYPILPSPYDLLGAVSPLYIACLLLFVSGVPRLERLADAKWGRDPAYQAYKQRSGALLPKLPRES